MGATEKMIDFAQKIAEDLDLPEPDYDNFEETSAFISEYKDEFYESQKDKWR